MVGCTADGDDNPLGKVIPLRNEDDVLRFRANAERYPRISRQYAMLLRPSLVKHTQVQFDTEFVAGAQHH